MYKHTCKNTKYRGKHRENAEQGQNILEGDIYTKQSEAILKLKTRALKFIVGALKFIVVSLKLYTGAAKFEGWGGLPSVPGSACALIDHRRFLCVRIKLISL